MNMLFILVIPACKNINTEFGILAFTVTNPPLALANP